VVPETAVSLLAFLLLLSPGLVFEWLRRAHRPSVQRSTFDEIATVVIASLVFTSVAVLVLAAINLISSRLLADVWQWIATGNEYFREHPRRSVWTVALALGIAWLAAVGANWLLCQQRYDERIRPLLRRAAAITPEAEVGPHSVWWGLVRDRVPRGTESVWITLEVEAGRQLTGVFHGYDTAGDSDARVVVLRKPFTSRVHQGEELPVDPSDTWQLLVVPMREVRAAMVLYKAHDSQ
jgi:hypothetical protein